MATLRADKKNYKKAFTTHANSYDKWSIGSDYSRRLLLCYCVECGLKMSDHADRQYKYRFPSQ